MKTRVDYSEYIEREPHGTDEFPIEFYHLDRAHHRYEMNLHWHPEAELIRVYEGSFELHLGGNRYVLGAGDAAVINPGTLHRGVPTDCVYGCAVFKTEMLSPAGAAVGRYVKPIAARTSTVREFFSAQEDEDARAIACIDRLFEELEGKAAGYELSVYASLYELFATLYAIGAVERVEGSGVHGRALAQMTHLYSWIDRHYTHPITLAELSRASGFNEKYLCRLFREQTSYTPIEYVNRLRVERAADDLLHKRMSVTEAAFANGFNDSAYFSKVFRRIKGVSPKEFKQRGE